MKRYLKKAALWILGLIVFFAVLGAIGVFAMYGSGDGLKTDWDTLKSSARLELFRRGFIPNITPAETAHLYQSKCYRACHGEEAMITAVLSSAGWFQVVERMRIKENVKISGREAEAIIKLLDEKFPKTKSRFSYEVRKQVHHAVWRNDIGLNDIYCDVYYVSKEYLLSIGADHLIDEYDIEHFHVFIVNFTVHEGEVALSELDKISTLRTSKGEMKTTPPWRLRFQTSDKHHYEGIVRFDKSNPIVASPDATWLELALRDVGAPGIRTYKWERDIKYPDELKDASVLPKEAKK